ncbi:MAG: tetratricopeptide repeat protein [Bacteroidales bacterium]|jgi:tetratricopeptide (TPR) repeat protein|nr:tetratricopeptide repeat protein [Bacteroidales bacterium]
MRFRILLPFLLVAQVAAAQLNINNFIRVGQIRIQTGNYVGAIENFNIVIKFRPGLPEPYFFRGLAKHQLEDFRGAIADYDEALKIKPYFPDAYINRGLAKLELNDYEEAIADYDRALEISPRNAGIYNNRGIAKLSLKDIDGAIADYNKALEISPNLINAYINRSNAYLIKGDIRNAIRDLNRVIIIRPQFAGAYLLRGLARFQLDDMAAALRDFDQTIRFDAKNAYAYNNRGIVKQRLEDLEGAIQDYNIALKLDPTLANAYFNRGIAKESLNRTDYEADYQFAMRLDPKLDIRRYRPETPQERYRRQMAQKNQNSPNPPTQPATILPADSTQQAEADSIAQQRRQRRFRLALADTRNIPGPDDDEADPDDGQIQNRNVIIELQNVFTLASFSRESPDYERLQYFSMLLEDLNRSNNYAPLITVTNQPTDEFTESFGENVAVFTDNIARKPTLKDYLCRGLFYNLLGRYNEALADLNAVIDNNKQSLLAYFTRANTRLNMVKMIEAVPEIAENMTITMDGNGNNFVPASPNREELIDYQYILQDLATCIELMPDFAFSWYNRAYIYCKLGKYEEALDDLTVAIKKQADFAEAYFNRGLIHIFMDDTDAGALDLSKAGELGIQDAYNVIKRFCN